MNQFSKLNNVCFFNFTKRYQVNLRIFPHNEYILYLYLVHICVYLLVAWYLSVGFPLLGNAFKCKIQYNDIIVIFYKNSSLRKCILFS